MYIPIMETLQSLLRNEVILFQRYTACMKAEITSTSSSLQMFTIHLYIEWEDQHPSLSVKEDFCDGKVFAKNPLFSVERNALQVSFVT